MNAAAIFISFSRIHFAHASSRLACLSINAMTATSSAPLAYNSFANATTVFPVSMISSIITHRFPRTVASLGACAVFASPLTVPSPYDAHVAHAITGRSYGRSSSARSVRCVTYVCRSKSLANIIAPVVTGTKTENSFIRITTSAASVSSAPSMAVASKSTDATSGSSTGSPATRGTRSAASGMRSDIGSE